MCLYFYGKCMNMYNIFIEHEIVNRVIEVPATYTFTKKTWKFLHMN